MIYPENSWGGSRAALRIHATRGSPRHAWQRRIVTAGQCGDGLVGRYLPILPTQSPSRVFYAAAFALLPDPGWLTSAVRFQQSLRPRSASGIAFPRTKKAPRHVVGGGPKSGANRAQTKWTVSYWAGGPAGSPNHLREPGKVNLATASMPPSRCSGPTPAD